jgi:hypothetical protein
MRRPAPPPPRFKLTTRRKYAIAGLVIISAVLIAGGIGFREFCRDLLKYGNIHNYDDRDEVLYRLGFPAAVLDDSQKNHPYPGRRSYLTNREASAADPDRVIPEGRTVADYYEWSYPVRGAPNAKATMYVDFDRATKFVENIDCVDFTDPPHYCSPLAGISIGDSEDRVRDRLGKPDRFTLDGVTKTMSYDGVGVEFKLTKGSVYYLRLSRTDSRNIFELLDFFVRSLFK